MKQITFKCPLFKVHNLASLQVIKLKHAALLYVSTYTSMVSGYYSRGKYGRVSVLFLSVLSTLKRI